MKRGLLTSSYWLDRFAAEAASSLPPGSRVLDAGAGDSPYREHFAHATYEAADVCVRDARSYPHVSFVCDLRSIPIPDARYDLVLCTQVLEHVPRPLEVLAELRRVLKPGGSLWASAPFSFEEHEVPYDFFRYTRFGWRELLSRAGLEAERIEWLQGYYGTLAHQLNLARHCLPTRPKDYGGGAVGLAASLAVAVLRPTLLASAAFFSRLDLRHRHTATGHCLDYRVVARRPG
jgi:SAM-dependent methyltransferase